MSSTSETLRILHLSDPHLTESGFDEDGVDAVSALDRILHDARFIPDLDLVVVSGDIADDGSVSGSAAVLDRVGRYAAERGVPHVYTTGNHDTRAAFTSVFGSGHLTKDGIDVGRLCTEAGDERAAVSEVRGLRVITLDSLVPGSPHGSVSATQLSWLRTVLAEPAPFGSVVVLHHPPGMLPQLQPIALQNAAELGAVIAGTDVHAVLCGHFHLQIAGSLGGVPLWSTPGIVTRADLTSAPHLLRVVRGAGASVVDLGGPYSPMFHVIQARDPEAGSLVYLLDLETGQNLEPEREGSASLQASPARP